MIFGKNSLPLPVAPERAPSATDFLRSLCGNLAALTRKTFGRKQPRPLLLVDTLSLGNRGFVAVVGYRRKRFLVGGAGSSVALLAELGELDDPATLCDLGGKKRCSSAGSELFEGREPEQ